MKATSTPKLPPEQISEAAVAAYLLKTPDFFEHHPMLLEILQVPHPSGGAISLIERQVLVLRERHQNLERRLAELVERARDSERMARHLHRMACTLMHAGDLDAVLSLTREALRDEVKAELVSIRLLDHPSAATAAPEVATPGAAGAGKEAAGKEAGKEAAVKAPAKAGKGTARSAAAKAAAAEAAAAEAAAAEAPAKDPATGDPATGEAPAPQPGLHSLQDKDLRHFEDLFTRGRARCGRMPRATLRALFDDEAESIGSAILMPLMVESQRIGVLGLASRSADRFQPDMGTYFVTHLGELLAEAIRYQIHRGCAA